MPKIGCLCGHVINLVEIPCPSGFLLISEQNLNNVEIAHKKHPVTAEIFDALDDKGMLVYRCDQCRRLFIFEDGWGNPPLIYRLET